MSAVFSGVFMPKSKSLFLEVECSISERGGGELTKTATGSMPGVRLSVNRSSKRRDGQRDVGWKCVKYVYCLGFEWYDRRCE